MAIKNASDLLVYAKTSNSAVQVTRVRVKTTNPFDMEDGQSTGKLSLSNVTDSFGRVLDNVATGASANDGASVLTAISIALSSYSYSSSSPQTDGDYTYRDFTSGYSGLQPTLQISDGTSTPEFYLKDDSVVIEITTPGSSAVFDPVAFSTSASFSTNMDLRDITNKDSNGWSESLGGLKSFEVSTDMLQSINPDVPLDGTDFFDKLKNRSVVDLSFSDRIINIIRTNLTQTGVDGFGSSEGTQLTTQPDPFGGNTALKFTTPASTSFKFIKYTLESPRLEGKNVNWSFYIKGSGSTTSATITVSNVATSQSAIVTTLEGDGSIAQASVGSQYWNITGLSTSNWTRVSFQMNNVSIANGPESNPDTLRLIVYPNVYNSQDTDAIFLSSWQIEFSPEATDYQDPTEITHWQGNALVSSLSYDAGVEDNLTCSASFTGTGDVYLNGLGPELIGDTEFDQANDGSNPSSSYWTLSGGTSVIENGVFTMEIGSSGTTSLQKSGLLNSGDYYLLTYTTAGTFGAQGNIVLEDAWDTSTNIILQSGAGTHKLQFRAGQNNFVLKNGSVPMLRKLSNISLKKIM